MTAQESGHFYYITFLNTSPRARVHERTRTLYIIIRSLPISHSPLGCPIGNAVQQQKCRS